MKKNSRHVALAIILILGISLSTFAQERLKIAIIPKNKIGVFWQGVLTGAKLGSVALGNVEVLWRVPFEENTLSQIAITEQCISEGVSGIVLAPFDKDSLAVPVAKAMKNKIPVVIFDSQLKGTAGKDYISFVSIDNKNAGALAGDEMVKLIKGRGRVVLLRIAPNQVNIADREKGFLSVITKYRDIQVTEKQLLPGATLDDALNESLKMGDNLRRADGIFCSYEQTTIAMLQALQKMGLAGKVKYVGFDTPSIAVEALKRGEISALVAQDPARIGFLGLKATVDHIRGKKVEPIIDTGVKIVTLENLNSPEVQKLLALPVKEE